MIKKIVGSGKQFEKKSYFSGLITCFSCYLKVDLYGSLNGQGADDKTPKISKRTAKIIYFAASNYGKRVKNLKISETFLIFELK